MQVLDTNIIIGNIRKGIENYPSDSFISIVTVGELKVFATRNKWGNSKKEKLFNTLQQINIIDISSDITDVYAQIDIYSQGFHPTLKLKKGLSARNMGKNDLWIAATAYYFGITLQTTDNDFDHLSDFGLKLDKILF